MQNEINTEINQAVEVKPVWHSPSISRIDIKRTMSTPGGSLSDSAFNSPGGSITSAV